MVTKRSTIMGYCYGVSQVIELAHKTLAIAKEKNLRAYSIGWFIHNPSVVKRFEEAGMTHIESPSKQERGVALIRAHGIGDPLRKEFEEANFILIDGTCATVAYSQRLIRTSNPNSHIVIIGTKGHSEVVALSQVWNEREEIIPVTVIESEQEVEKLPLFGDKQIVLMTQTTFGQQQYNTLRALMEEKYQKRLLIGNKLCPTTFRRHKALLELCDEVEAVIVVGGLMSANTSALAQLVKERGLPVWHIESHKEIPQEISSYSVVGVTAGASTPTEDIEAVIGELEKM